MTKAPGAGIYMPPEALEDKPEDENNDEEQEETRAKYLQGTVMSPGVPSL